MLVAVEGREAQPLIHVHRRLVVGQRVRQVLEQYGLDAAEAPALGRDPRIEHRTARDLETLEQLAAKQFRELPLPLDA